MKLLSVLKRPVLSVKVNVVRNKLDRMSIVKNYVGNLRTAKARQIKNDLGIKSFSEIDRVDVNLFNKVLNVKSFANILFFSDRTERRLINYMSRKFVKFYSKDIIDYVDTFRSDKNMYLSYKRTKKDGSKEDTILNSKRIQNQIKDTLNNFNEDEMSKFAEIVIKVLAYLYTPLNSYQGADRSTFVALISNRILTSFIEDAREIDEIVETRVDQLATLIIWILSYFKFIIRGTTKKDNKTIAIYKYNKEIVNRLFLEQYLNYPELLKYAKYGISMLFIKETQKGFRTYLPERYRLTKVGKIVGGYENSANMAQTGHIKKVRNKLSKAHLELLNRLSSQEYTLIDSIWKDDKVMEEVVLRIANIKSLDDLDLVNSKEDENIYKTYQTVKKEISYLKDMVYNKGKSLYISWNYGPDNGRVYCEQGVFGFQKGWINHLFQLKNGQVLKNQATINLYSDLAAKFEYKYEDTKDVKYKIMYLGYREAVLKAIAGKPTGVMVEFDAKASGTAMQGLALRSKSIMRFTGQLHKFIEQTYDLDMYIEISKGIKLIKSNGDILGIDDIVELTGGNQREIGKSAFRGFVYGAGETAVNNDVLGDLKLSIEEYSLDWEYFLNNYKKMVPEMAVLRDYLLKLSYKLQQKEVKFLDYTALDGFPCTITSLSKEGIEHKRRDVLFPGELTINKKIIDSEYLGVRIVGAFSHHIDSTILRNVLSQLFIKDINIVPIHDAFMIHGNDIVALNDAYNKAQNAMLKLNPLENYLFQIMRYLVDEEQAKNSAKVAASRMMSDYDAIIEGGLFGD